MECRLCIYIESSDGAWSLILIDLILTETDLYLPWRVPHLTWTICHILPDSWKPIEEIKKIMNLLWNSGSSVCVSKNVIGYHHVYSSQTNSLREFLIFMINVFMYYFVMNNTYKLYSLWEINRTYSCDCEKISEPKKNMKFPRSNIVMFLFLGWDTKVTSKV